MSAPLVLLIVYHFPPDTAIGGARPFRFYKYLKRLGYECHVITAARQETDAAEDVEYVPDPLRTSPGRGFAWQAERIVRRFLLRGGLTLGWSISAFRAARLFLNNRRDGDIVILSSAPPAGTHLAAMRLAACFGRPWIADFRDPINTVAGDRAPLQNIIAPSLERLVLKRADLTLANTDAMFHSFRERYSGLDRKTHVLWNGFDPEDAIGAYALPRRERKVLSHVGELYGGRDIRPVLQAAARLIESGRVPAKSILIRQIGFVAQAELPDPKFLRAAASKGWLEFREEVPPQVARTMALDSDGLLLIQPHTAIQVPGKLFEYLRMGRPILAYVVRDSPAERILQQAGVPFECVFPEDTPDQIEEKFLSFIAMLDGRPASYSPWFADNFEASRQIETLVGLIRSLTG